MIDIMKHYTAFNGDYKEIAIILEKYLCHII